MKLALLLNAISPEVGGVLIRGEKGTAKSTAARGLSELLPSVRTNTGDLVQAPFVDLPLGATEDRLIGSIDLEKAVLEGKPTLQFGVLAKAHQGILYVDEVNLLNDHLVDSILDVAESGTNRIEREGLSASHPSQFILIGTMNPEEGDLRPQFLDRFGLSVEITGEQDVKKRKQLLVARESFDGNPKGFRLRYEAGTQQLRDKIGAARVRLPEVSVPKHLLVFISEICTSNHVAGHRADLVIQKAARAFAAWMGRTEVEAKDITTIAPMALLHRMRNSETPPEIPPPPSQSESEDSPTDEEQDKNTETQNPSSISGQTTSTQDKGDNPDDSRQENKKPGSNPPPMPPPSSDQSDEVQQAGDPFRVMRFQQNDLRNLRSGSGRRNRTRSATRQGRYIKSSFRIRNNDLALDATLRAAAPYQQVRRSRHGNHMAVYIDTPDHRGKVREKRIGSFLLFAVDASGSMGAQKRMSETKSAILSLLLDAYQKRDRVAMISFRGKESQIVLPPTNSIDLAAKLLQQMPVGGRTPLPAALVETGALLRQALHKEPTLMPMVLLLTDGRANAGIGNKGKPLDEALFLSSKLKDEFPQTRFVVVDTEPQGLIRLGLAQRIAIALGAEYFMTSDLKAEQLIALTKR
ncbi:MAG: magnesium chelatase subunit D family protein [Opitutales bacterium]|nr:magnesium chelatase subunit D family protein [Opitutales bacterium]